MLQQPSVKYRPAWRSSFIVVIFSVLLYLREEASEFMITAGGGMNMWKSSRRVNGQLDLSC